MAEQSENSVVGKTDIVIDEEKLPRRIETALATAVAPAELETGVGMAGERPSMDGAGEKQSTGKGVVGEEFVAGDEEGPG